MTFKYVTADRRVSEADITTFKGDDAKGTDKATGRPVELVWDGRVWKEAR